MSGLFCLFAILAQLLFPGPDRSERQVDGAVTTLRYRSPGRVSEDAVAIVRARLRSLNLDKIVTVRGAGPGGFAVVVRMSKAGSIARRGGIVARVRRVVEQRGELSVFQALPRRAASESYGKNAIRWLPADSTIDVSGRNLRSEFRGKTLWIGAEMLKPRVLHSEDVARVKFVHSGDRAIIKIEFRPKRWKEARIGRAGRPLVLAYDGVVRCVTPRKSLPDVPVLSWQLPGSMTDGRTIVAGIAGGRAFSAVPQRMVSVSSRAATRVQPEPRPGAVGMWFRVAGGDRKRIVDVVRERLKAVGLGDAVSANLEPDGVLELSLRPGAPVGRVRRIVCQRGSLAMVRVLTALPNASGVDRPAGEAPAGSVEWLKVAESVGIPDRVLTKSRGATKFLAIDASKVRRIDGGDLKAAKVLRTAPMLEIGIQCSNGRWRKSGVGKPQQYTAIVYDGIVRMVLHVAGNTFPVGLWTFHGRPDEAYAAALAVHGGPLTQVPLVIANHDR